MDMNNGIYETIKLAGILFQKKEELKQKLPYHINVIDELHINENGHSRILTKLLKYKNPAGPIVFENKVYNAQDQDAQLDRYIEKTLAHGFDQQQIYIIYLPQYPHEPAEGSVPKSVSGTAIFSKGVNSL